MRRARKAEVPAPRTPSNVRVIVPDHVPTAGDGHSEQTCTVCQRAHVARGDEGSADPWRLMVWTAWGCALASGAWMFGALAGVVSVHAGGSIA